MAEKPRQGENAAVHPALVSSAVFGALCAPVGIGVGALVGYSATGSGWAWFFIPAGLAAFLTASASWWLIVERNARPTLLRGALAGAAAGVVAHYVCWYFLLLGNYAFAAATGGRLGGEAGAIDPLSATWAALAYVFWSLLLFGWLTLPAGAALGAAYAKWRQSCHSRDRGNPMGSPTTRG